MGALPGGDGREDVPLPLLTSDPFLLVPAPALGTPDAISSELALEEDRTAVSCRQRCHQGLQLKQYKIIRDLPFQHVPWDTCLEASYFQLMLDL